MASVTFDTLKFVERLKAAGMPEAQAKALSEAQREVFSEALDSAVATKGDIAGLRHEMDLLRAEFKEDMSALRGEMADLRAEVKIVRWLLGFLVAGMLAVLIRLFMH